MDDHATFTEFRGHLDRFRDAARCGGFQHDAVDNDVNRMLEFLVELDRLALELADFAVDADAREAFFLEVRENLRMLSLAPHHDRGQNHGALALAQPQDFIGDLVGRALLDFSAAFGAMRHANTRVQQAQIVIDFRDRAHRGTRILRRGFLINRDCGRKTVDTVEVGLVHLPEELARIGRKAFDVATLAFGIDGIEGQARLSASRQSGDHDQLVARDGRVDVLQIVLASAAYDDRIACHIKPLFF